MSDKTLYEFSERIVSLAELLNGRLRTTTALSDFFSRATFTKVDAPMVYAMIAAITFGKFFYL
jgi:hypothetical protein